MHPAPIVHKDGDENTHLTLKMMAVMCTGVVKQEMCLRNVEKSPEEPWGSAWDSFSTTAVQTLLMDVGGEEFLQYDISYDQSV
jgi:hypothetical protein